MPAALGGVPDHVHDQAHAAINEVFPRPGLLLQAAIQQVSVNFGERHAFSPLMRNNCPWPRKRAASRTADDLALAARAQTARHCQPKPYFDFRQRSRKKQVGFSCLW